MKQNYHTSLDLESSLNNLNFDIVSDFVVRIYIIVGCDESHRNFLWGATVKPSPEPVGSEAANHRSLSYLGGSSFAAGCHPFGEGQRDGITAR